MLSVTAVVIMASVMGLLVPCSCQSLYGSTFGTSLPTSACSCTFDYRPVCGTNGKTYSNPCQLRCEQMYNPTVIQVSEGPCGILGTTSFNSPYPPSIYNQIYGGNAVGGTNLVPNLQSCVWSCPAFAGSYGGVSSYASTYLPGSGAGYIGQATVGTYPGLYGPTDSILDPSASGQVCDSRGNKYANDCQYYRGMCEWEKRGVLIARAPCTGNGGGLYGATVLLQRSVKLSQDEAPEKKNRITDRNSA